MIKATEQTYSFAEFEVDAKKRRLSKNGQTIMLNSKAFDLLLALIENRGQIVHKEELLEKVWANQFVEENNLTVHISALRKVFGEKKGEHQFIATIPGKGYKFVAELNEPNAENEIVIENHSFSPIIIDEEVETSIEPSVISDNQATKQIENIGGVRFRQNLIYVALFGGLLILTVFGGNYWRQKKSAVLFDQTRIRQLTTNGKVVLAALAPDAKTFAYVVNDAGQRSIWTGNVDGGNHLQLRAAETDAIYSELAFAPDAGRLYYCYKNDRNAVAALYRMPVSGGVPEKIADGVENFALSPDGGKIAFGRREGANDALLVANLDGSEPRHIAVFPKAASFVFDSVSWSPDGGRLAFSRISNAKNSLHDLATANVSSGQIEIIKSDARHKISNTAWLKDGSIIVTALRDDSRASFPQYRLLRIDLGNGQESEITGDLSSYDLALDVSADSTAILTIEQRQLNNVWIAPADDLSRAKQITFGSFGKYDGLWGLDFTPDGKIIYTNSDTQSQFISQMDADGRNSKPLTAPGVIDSVLNVSNDGRYIVFHSNRGGGDFDIWRTDVDGGNPKQLTSGQKNYQPFVSADNRWVYYKSWETDTGELRRVLIDGGAPEILNDKETSWLSFSPDGKYFAAAYKTDCSRLAVFDAATNQVIKQFDLPKNATMSIGSRWSPDSRAVAFRDWNGGYWLQSIKGGEPRKMEGLPNEKFYNFAWSKDGRQFAFVRGQEIRDVVLLQTVDK